MKSDDVTMTDPFDLDDLTSEEKVIREKLETLRANFEREAGALLKRFADGRNFDDPIIMMTIASSDYQSA